MALLTQETTLLLWEDIIQHAEYRCSIKLNKDLETYLAALLIRYTNKPEVAQQIFADAYLKALQEQKNSRNAMLQNVGDQCLIFAGLFPQQAEKRHVRVSYFVNLGRSAYSTISHTANDLYWALALQFVALMDVLQSIRQTPELMPLQAYDQWQELGSQRAFQALQDITQGLSIKKSH